jgi:hypothetical protein
VANRCLTTKPSRSCERTSASTSDSGVRGRLFPEADISPGAACGQCRLPTPYSKTNLCKIQSTTNIFISNQTQPLHHLDSCQSASDSSLIVSIKRRPLQIRSLLANQSPFRRQFQTIGKSLRDTEYMKSAANLSQKTQ